MIDHLDQLKISAKGMHGYYVFVSPVLEDPRFEIWSGSGSDKHHHYGDGGLLKHTCEVLDYCSDIAARHNGHNSTKKTRVNPQELFISAIWHDYGKIWDYQKDENGVWGKHNNHARQIHHISRSALEFEKHYDYHLINIDKNLINKDNIIHNILSHHGSREWGSPVSPATREAWILHLADNLSARLDDCNTYDKF